MAMQERPAARRAPVAAGRWPGVLAWALAWLGLWLLDGRVDLANQALLLILGSAVAALWLPPLASALAIAIGVLAFNFSFVPPRGTLAVDLHQHGLLLLAMLSVSGIVSALVARLRRLAEAAGQHARRADEQRRLGELLRATDDPASGADELRRMLGALTGGSAVLMFSAPGPARWAGEADANESAGLQLCAREGRALGPGSGRHEEQPAWYLPLRGRQHTGGAALVRLPGGAPADAAARTHAQALCDQLGLALERAAAEQAAAIAREQAQAQALRNTLLSAVAHDHRTPLATIASAAGALHDQGDRLDAAQRRRLAATIVDEATQLARITDNTLQLARLDAVGIDLHVDWESIEELIGSVLRRQRQRDPGHRLRARVEPGLPLLRCDAVLIVQLLENLVDNALRHGGDQGPVEVVARRAGDQLLVAVRDRGPGLPEGWREQVFEPFTRGPATAAGPADAPRGSGIGLALCRAIARVHRGTLVHRARRGGGSAFELSLPVDPAPPLPADRSTREDA